MDIQFIYSFWNDLPQLFIDTDIGRQALDTPEILGNLAQSYLTDTQLENLAKISCCLTNFDDDPNTLPDWYLEANGKLYFHQEAL